MSLVTDQLRQRCTIKKPVFNSDESIASFQTVAADVPVLISQNRTMLFQDMGGRQVLDTLTAYFELMDETQLDVNFVLTDVYDTILSRYLMDTVNGGVPTRAAFKVTGSTDPNYEGDHLEIPVEHYHGRTEGQP